MVNKTKDRSRIRDFEALNARSPLGSFFQSREFYEVLKLANRDPFFVTASKERDAGLLAYNFPDTRFISRFFPNLIVYYGPVLGRNADSNNLDNLLRDLDIEAQKRGAVRVDIRTQCLFRKMHNIFVKNRYVRYDPGGEYSVIIDLTKDQNTLWREMTKRARRSIKRAIKNNVKIREVTSKRDLYGFYKIYVSTTRRRNFAPYSFSFFDSIRLKLERSGVAKFFLAWHGGRPIASILITIYNGQSVVFINASLKEYWGLCPNHLLHWHSICWSKSEAKANTFKLYHLPKSKPKSGIDYHSFKTSFGGNLIHECYFYYKIVSQIKWQVLETLSKLLQVGNAIRILRRVQRKLKLEQHKESLNF